MRAAPAPRAAGPELIAVGTLRRRTATPDGRWVVLWYVPAERRWYCDAEGLNGGPVVGGRLRATVAAATGERADAPWIEEWIERAVIGAMR